MCCLVLQSNFALWLTIQFASLFLFFFIFFLFFCQHFVRAISLEPLIAETPNECAAWSCGLILHCCLPSNLLCYLFIFFSPPRFCHNFVRAISLELLLAETQIECAAWSCGLIVHYCLPSNSLCYLFFFVVFSATILSGPYLWNRYSQRLQTECAI